MTSPDFPPTPGAAPSNPSNPSDPSDSSDSSGRSGAPGRGDPSDRSALVVEGLDVAAGRLGLVHDVTFRLDRGDRVGLIGESGSGKSLTALAIMGLLPEGLSAAGTVHVPTAGAADGTDVVTARESVVADLRGRVMSMVFQEPMTALNPLMRVGRQVAEVEIGRASCRERVCQYV